MSDPVIGGSETALTGRHGTFTVDGEQIARCTQWSMNDKHAHVSEWGDSDSGGHTNRKGGRKDSTFSCEGKFDVDSPVCNVFAVDDVVEVYLYMSNIAPRWAKHYPRALCLDFKITTNIDTEEVIGWTAEFGEDGVSYGIGSV